MKNTVSKGILFYIFMLIAVVLGVLCILGAILIFSPGTEIFGMSYYVNHTNLPIKTTLDGNENAINIDDLFDRGQIETISVTTNYANMTIETREEGFVRFVIEPTLTGLVTSENKDTFSYSCSYDSTTKTLSLNVLAPKMLLAFNNSIDVVLSIPQSIVNTNLNINFNTQSGKFFVGNSELDNYTLKSLSVVSEKSSTVTLGLHTVISDEISINVPSGNIRLKNNITTNILNIYSDSAKIETKNINAHEINIDTVSSSINMEDITVETTFNYNARRGVLMIANLNGDLNNSEDVIISNITIGTVDGDVLLPGAESSDIKIETLKGRGTITTASGDVTINDAQGYLWVITESGKIDVNIDTDLSLDTGSYEEEQGIVNLETQSGTININVGKLLLKNYIKTTSGKINCNISPELNLIIDYNCAKNAPTLSTGLSSGESANQGSISMGSSSTNNHVIINNEKGKTSIQDTYVVKTTK